MSKWRSKKRYTITITGRVQEVGFRGYLEDLCKRLSIPSIIYNTGIEELKLLCKTDPKTLKELFSYIKQYKIAEIRDMSIDGDVELPYPPFRAVLGIEHEIFTRLDDGVKILHSIKSDTQKLDKLDKLDGMDGKLDGMNGNLDRITQQLKKLDKLDEMSETLNGMADTLKEISGKL